MLIFGFGIMAGLLLTPERRFLRTKWLWIGGLVAFLIFLPNLLWNVQHHFPFLELQANIRRSGRNVDLTPLAFLGQEILAMPPMSAPVWVAGLWYFFFSREGKPFRAPGWTWLATAMVPLLPVETYIRYSTATHRAPPRIETQQLGPLPHTTAIFAQNYCQAGAVDLLGPKYGLPKALSGHQSHYLWGPRGYTGQSVIVIEGRPEELEKVFQLVRKVARVEHPYSMPHNHFEVFYCRGLRLPLKEFWPKVKSWG